MNKSTVIAKLAATRGRFFTLSFEKKDGTERTICAQITRLENPSPKPLRNKGYVVVKNVNTAKKYPKGGYTAIHPSRVKLISMES
jgi:hypothetical protein